MSAQFTISGDALRLGDSMLLRRYSSIVLRVFKLEAQKMAGHVIRTQMSGVLGPSPRNRPNKALKARRTGNLARSITARVVGSDQNLAIQVGVFRGPSVRYAALQEFGTRAYNPDSPFSTIVPKRSKYLTVPTEVVKTPAGVARYGPREAPEALKPLIFKSPRNRVAGVLVFLRQYLEEKQRAILEDRDIDYRNIPAVFLLLTAMDVRPGFFVSDGVEDYLPSLIETLAQRIAEDI